MKKIFFVGLLSIISMCTVAQTNREKKELIQKLLDVDVCQEFYNAVEIDGVQRLCIFDNGIIPSNLSVEKFGNPVVFYSIEELFFRNIDKYLHFQLFTHSETGAKIVFKYNSNSPNVELEFEKINGEWLLAK